MQGLVLWSDMEERKAVFWCEDQGDLAFYHQQDNEAGQADFFEAGDMVQFSIRMEGKLRRAEEPRLVTEHACPDLPGKLSRLSPITAPLQGIGPAEVITLRRPSEAQTISLKA